MQIDAKHAIAHNKIMVIDGQTVITGSFNFTKAAEEHNAENLLVIREKTLADKYTANWKAHAAHAEPYEGKENFIGRIRTSQWRAKFEQPELLGLIIATSPTIGSKRRHRRRCLHWACFSIAS